MTQPIRVLLADDQELFRGGIAVIVGSQPDMTVVGQARNGAEAVRLVDELAPDVVLMDMRMPELSGAEATRQLFQPERVAAQRNPSRVIVLTTFALDDQARAAIRFGASGFLLKDTSPEFLIAAIRAVHSGSVVVSPGDLSLLFQSAPQEPPAAEPLPVEFGTLTERETQVFGAVARGLSNAEICAELFLSESTVKTHVSHVLVKLGLRDRVQLVVFAHRYAAQLKARAVS